MGGKVAMWLALHHPERVNRLVPVDMAPVKYPHRFENIFTALETLPLQHLASRSAADAWLARTLDSAGLRAFLLQNLLKHGEIWRWRINLRVLRGAIETLPVHLRWPLRLHEPTTCGTSKALFPFCALAHDSRSRPLGVCRSPGGLFQRTQPLFDLLKKCLHALL
jgi:pimeloyl-ACP methyl ester carboxylesterase